MTFLNSAADPGTASVLNNPVENRLGSQKLTNMKGINSTGHSERFNEVGQGGGKREGSPGIWLQ